jgi:Amt family ammonium transporter
MATSRTRKNPNILFFAGMVSMCAGCNVFEPWAALLIGLMAGFVFIGIHTLMLRFKQDDPLDAVAVHLGSGVLGVLAVPFFSYGDGIFWMGNTMAPWHLLGVNLAGVVSIFLWAAFCSGLIFGSLKFFNQLRIDSTTEFKGCDRVSICQKVCTTT